ncbi:Putative ribonuclease H protein At1g65750 [Linum perenne]
MMNMGNCSITRAKIREILEGMRLVWDRGVRQLAVQTDSVCAVRLLSNSHNEDHQHVGFTRLFNQMMERDWTVTLSHVFRESELLANSLAAKGHDSIFRTHLVEASDPSVAS